MKEVIILHNPQCSKSRETLNLLISHGLKPQIIEYLKEDLSIDFLRSVASALQMHPKEFLRIKEEEFQSLKINFSNADEILQAIQQHPKLLERPIVLSEGKAVIGRPPETVLKLFGHLV